MRMLALIIAALALQGCVYYEGDEVAAQMAHACLDHNGLPSATVVESAGADTVTVTCVRHHPIARDFAERNDK